MLPIWFVSIDQDFKVPHSVRVFCCRCINCCAILFSFSNPHISPNHIIIPQNPFHYPEKRAKCYQPPAKSLSSPSKKKALLLRLTSVVVCCKIVKKAGRTFQLSFWCENFFCVIYTSAKNKILLLTERAKVRVDKYSVECDFWFGVNELTVKEIKKNNNSILTKSKYQISC